MEEMELLELEKYRHSMEELRKKVAKRANELMNGAGSTSQAINFLGGVNSVGTAIDLFAPKPSDHPLASLYNSMGFGGRLF